MTGIHMVEGMSIVEERSPKELPEVEDMDMEVERMLKERPEVEGMNMVEDMTVEVVKRGHEGMVLVRHWIDDGVESHR
jgi:hypothetical protein